MLADIHSYFITVFIGILIYIYVYVNFLSNFANWSIKVGAAYANKLRIRYVVQVLEGVRETDTR